MRAETRSDGFSVRAIAGTRVVLLAMNAREEQTRGLLGFAIARRNTPGGSIRWLNGFKAFRELVPDPARGQRFRTSQHPIQSFLWGFYAAEPGAVHHFVVRPLFRPAHGDLARLRPGPDLEISVTTESETAGKHSILFNRGASVAGHGGERRLANRPEAGLGVLIHLPCYRGDRSAWGKRLGPVRLTQIVPTTRPDIR